MHYRISYMDGDIECVGRANKPKNALKLYKKFVEEHNFSEKGIRIQEIKGKSAKEIKLENLVEVG